MQTFSRTVLIKQIVLASLDTAEERRNSFICASCGGDELLEKEVRSLLSFYSQQDTRLESSPLNISAGAFASKVLRELQAPITCDLGHYRIVGEIGRGGMGVVYEAVRVDGEYEQRVAIKLVATGPNAEFIARLLRKERQILANLNHPNIAKLLDGGTTEGGMPYLVMEYVEGVPIDKYAETNALTITDRLKLFRTVCLAVQYAHEKSVIHRDIKPNNILVDKTGTPKLLDFGIAKLQATDDHTEPATRTTAGLMLTPEYSSPEQLSAGAITNASDIYSLGVVLYKLFTGGVPYDCKNDRMDEIARAVSTEPPKRPSSTVGAAGWIARRGVTTDGEQVKDRQAAAALRKQLRGDLDNIALKALRKEPEHRYASAAELAEDITRHLEGLPISARRGAVAYRAQRFLKRNTFAICLVSVAVLCIAIGIALTLHTVRSEPPRRIAVMPFENASQDLSVQFISDGISNSLSRRLSRYANLIVPTSSSAFHYTKENGNIQELGRQLGADAILTVRVIPSGDTFRVDVDFVNANSNVIIWSAHYKGDSSHLRLLQRQIETDVLNRLALQIAADDELRKRDTSDDEAYRLYMLGNYFWNKRTQPGFTTAIDCYQQAIQRDPTYAMAYDGLAKSYGLMGAYMMAPPHETFPKAKAAAERALQLDENLAEAHTTLALVNWLYDWNWAAADDEFKRAIELNPQYVTAHHWYGLYLGEMGFASEAIAEVKRALALDPASVAVRGDLGRVLFWARRYDEALDEYRKAGQMDPKSGSSLVEARYVYEQKKMYVEWFSSLYELGEVNEHNRRAVLEMDWKEFVRLRARNGPPHDRAENYARLGDADNAFYQLNLAYNAHDHRLSQLRVNPVWDPLRGDPRFVELLRRLGL